ncbi:YidB family protein [Oligoflexaceae bacterium]|nr:YidB family protein [Oligoflexaceae bacterium]
MDIMQIGAQLLASKFGGGVQASSVQSALGGLFGKSAQGGPDLAGLIGKLSGGGMQGLVGSWLGSGENQAMNEEQVESAFGADKIQDFAKAVGQEPAQVKAGLKDVLPQMVDKASPNGNLAESLGSLGGLAGMAGKLFN